MPCRVPRGKMIAASGGDGADDGDEDCDQYLTASAGYGI